MNSPNNNKLLSLEPHPEEPISSSSASSSSQSKKATEAQKKQFKDLTDKIANLGKWISYVIIALVLTVGLSMVGIAIDIYLDIDRYDSLQGQIIELMRQTDDLNKDNLNFYKESLEKQSILDCLKRKGEKYWEYSECFE